MLTGRRAGATLALLLSACTSSPPTPTDRAVGGDARDASGWDQRRDRPLAPDARPVDLRGPDAPHDLARDARPPGTFVAVTFNTGTTADPSPLQLSVDGKRVERSTVKGFTYYYAKNSISVAGLTVPKGSEVKVSYSRW